MSDRAEELEQLLEDQPGSRLFVQLAEEYRRLERYDDAIRTLKKGLEDQPTYVSARVLLGRCRLESGDSAGAIPELEQVLRQDQTHPLAHKLLAEAHLETGDVDAARERLDLYEMLNESDPEIEELRARLPEGGGDGEPESASSDTDSAAPEPTASEPSEDDLFDLGSSPRPVAPASEDEDLLGIWEPETEPEAEVAHGETPPDEVPPPGDGDPFGDLWSSDDRRRLDHGLAEEGLFAEPPAVEEAPAAEAAAPPETEEGPAEPEAAGEPQERPTVTLGRLYLQQGHHDEARRIFREVLDREPDHAEARAELLRLDTEAEPDREMAAAAPEAGVAAPEPGAPPESAPEPGVAVSQLLTAPDLEEPGAQNLGLTERKIRLLNNYLRQIRRASEQHVR